MSADHATAGALDGVVVLDLTHVVAGPYATMMLGDMGAEVIKLEPPGGETVRRSPPFDGDGMSSSFRLMNRNKKSIVLDLRTQAGRAALHRIVSQVDVVVENFRPGVARRLGLEYHLLRTLNPGLVMASISGFGQTGPYAGRGGLDLIAQAMSGVMSVTGEPNGRPLKCGVPVADIMAGLLMIQGVLLAIIRRATTGEGQYVDVSLYDSAVALSVSLAAAYWGGGELPQRRGNGHPFMAPYEEFATADGFIVAAGPDELWPQFCTALGAGELTRDPRFATRPDRNARRAELKAAIETILRKSGSDYWLTRFEEAGVPAGPIRTYDQVFSDPHTIARDMVVAGPGGRRQLGNPVHLSGTPWSLRHDAPELGAHSREVLARFGFSATEIDQLTESGSAGAA